MKFLLIVSAIVILLAPITGAMALASGLLIALISKQAFQTAKITPKLLTYSVAALGAGMNLETVIRAGMNGVVYTFIGLLTAFILGAFLMRLFSVEKESGFLITTGTAICGGSAIAAMGPVIGASSLSMSVALGTVFILNSVALLTFPTLGHFFALTQEQFGLWSALAIHDTSSVVGATLIYGERAAEIGTTIKLSRALWIIPITLIASTYLKKKNKSSSDQPIKKPWFILAFLLIAALVTYIPEIQPIGKKVEWLGRKMLVLTLFLVGLSLTREKIKHVGFKPFAFGVTLWLLISSASLLAIKWFHLS
jgi:uncharacterized integral membrane protein (TIGR00698 family)